MMATHETLTSEDEQQFDLPVVEPGASQSHYLITKDNYEELDDSSDTEMKQSGRQARSRGGTIRTLKKEQTLAVSGLRRVDSGHLSSDDAGNSESSAVSDNEEHAVPQVSEIIENIRHLSGPTQQADEEEEEDVELAYVKSHQWRNQSKHVFVLSQSGKPIYCRHGNEEKLVTLYGVMQALVSVIHHSPEKDDLRSVIAGRRKIVILVKENLIFVAVSSLQDSLRHLQLQLSYVYNQIISQITLSQLNKIFHQRVNFDLRRMLTGTEKFIDNCLDVIDRDMSCILGSVRCLALQPHVRDTVTQTLLQNCKPLKESLVFSIILSQDLLVTIVRMKRFSLHPQDLHILINMIQSSATFKTAESWLPICLPKFDSSGFLHAYISYLDDMCNTCLIMLTVNNDMFPQLSQCKKAVTERLNRYSCLQAIAESATSGSFTTQQVGLPELNHFIYKSRSTAQLTSPSLGLPYLTDEQKQRLHGIYMNVHGQMHSGARPIRIVYKVLEYESVLGWVTDGFELYAVFGPLISKSAAIISVNKLLKWMKKEETRLFVMNPATF